MVLKTFKGGVHPYEGKELAKDQPIKELLPKGQLVYPLSQHIGAPANPIVAVGDTVLRGQMIAEAGGFVSSPIFASVSGTVKAIEPRRVAVGDKVKSIVIENDGEYKEVEYQPCNDISALSKEDIIADYQQTYTYVKTYIKEHKDILWDVSSEKHFSLPETMEALIERIEDKYGSVINYIRCAGVSDEAIKKIKERICGD